MFGLSGTVVVAEEKPIPNLIDNYLESFTQDFSEEFIFSAYCYGIFIDIGTELESVGKEDKDPEVRKLGEAILERADIHYEDYISQFLEEIDPNWWARAGASISTETEDSAAVKRLDDSINLIADGDDYSLDADINYRFDKSDEALSVNLANIDDFPESCPVDKYPVGIDLNGDFKCVPIKYECTTFDNYNLCKVVEINVRE